MEQRESTFHFNIEDTRRKHAEIIRHTRLIIQKIYSKKKNEKTEHIWNNRRRKRKMRENTCCYILSLKKCNVILCIALVWLMWYRKWVEEEHVKKVEYNVEEEGFYYIFPLRGDIHGRRQYEYIMKNPTPPKTSTRQPYPPKRHSYWRLQWQDEYRCLSLIVYIIGI